MSETNINAALVTAAVAALGAGYANRIAYEARDFTPPASGKWAAIYNLRAGTSVASLGVGGQDDHDGVLQIDLSVPENSGTETLLTDADAMRAYFIGGRHLIYSGQCVVVRRCDVSPIRQVDGYLRISASVTYQSRSTRPTL